MIKDKINYHKNQVSFRSILSSIEDKFRGPFRSADQIGTFDNREVSSKIKSEPIEKNLSREIQTIYNIINLYQMEKKAHTENNRRQIKGNFKTK